MSNHTLTWPGCNVSSTTRTSSASSASRPVLSDAEGSVSSRGLGELGQHLLGVVLLAEETTVDSVLDAATQEREQSGDHQRRNDHCQRRHFGQLGRRAHLPGQRRRWYYAAVSNNIKLLETVISTANFPGHSVLAGDLGTVVEIYTVPRLAYEVEFVNPDGSTRALLTLAPDQVRRLSPVDVMTTRQAPLAA